MRRVCVVGTGLIGASVGLALKAGGFSGEVLGWDASRAELDTALQMGALDRALPGAEAVLTADAEVTVLATPVLAVLDWMQRLAPVLGEAQLVTDVGSTKAAIAAMASTLFNQPGQARFLAGHPMAGKESGGAALAEPTLFRGATWLFTPPAAAEPKELELWWRERVAGFGAVVRDLPPERHDEVCAWVSHLPQYLSTALAALLEETFAKQAGQAGGLPDDIRAVGGRALREMTRLGASPYSMWRDIALTNTENVAATLWALEQRLAHLRENLRTPELREEFAVANQFKAGP
jgi:prephenate dehydrogenase